MYLQVRGREQRAGSQLEPFVPHVLVEFFHSEHEPEVWSYAEKPRMPPGSLVEVSEVSDH